VRPSLRSTLIKLVVAAAPLAAAGCLSEYEDPCPPVKREVRLDNPVPTDLAHLVQACVDDETTCLDLCQLVVMQNWSDFVTSCTVTHDATGHDLHLTTQCLNVGGRRPAGLARARKVKAGITGRYLARAAWFEAASIHAFVSLARQLARYNAPVALRDAAKRAAVDEIQHARLMGALARARGATPPPVEIEKQGRRSLESIAIENVTEGVVGETWAALIAFWQATHATDPTLRATYATSAEDELRHAELSIEIDTWAKSKLRSAARRRVEAARTKALAKLARNVKTTVPAALVAELGMPGAAALQRLFADARAAVWA